jgi:hypothetical protein
LTPIHASPLAAIRVPLGCIKPGKRIPRTIRKVRFLAKRIDFVLEPGQAAINIATIRLVHSHVGAANDFLVVDDVGTTVNAAEPWKRAMDGVAPGVETGHADIDARLCQPPAVRI